MMISMRILSLLLILLFVSCRGTTMKDPPIHFNPNMDDVERLDPQSTNPATYFDGDTTVMLIPNGASMLPLEEGTVPRLNDKSEFDENKWYLSMGRNQDGALIKKVSDHFTVDKEFVMRGKERYNISCSPCHGITGDGKGIVASDNFSWNKNALPANLHTISLERDSMVYDGYIYKVISEGYGAMMGYKDISVDDRWRIVSYVRALTHKSGDGK